MQSAMHEDMLLGQPRYADPRSLARHRARVFSQNGEDGAIAEILRRIGPGPNQVAVEIGAGDGRENCTRFLVEQGWRALWCEGDPANTAIIRSEWSVELAGTRLVLADGLVTRDNVGAVLAGVPADFDVLSIDIDMNTSHVWRAMARYRPRIAVVEYNPTFPPSVEWEVPYDPRAIWKGDSYFGASLKTLEKLGEELGYRLVGCELSGVNAFFVREDLATEDKFLAPFAAEMHYEPVRLLLPVGFTAPARMPMALEKAA